MIKSVKSIRKLNKHKTLYQPLFESLVPYRDASIKDLKNTGTPIVGKFFVSSLLITIISSTPFYRNPAKNVRGPTVNKQLVCPYLFTTEASIIHIEGFIIMQGSPYAIKLSLRSLVSTQTSIRLSLRRSYQQLWSQKAPYLFDIDKSVSIKILFFDFCHLFCKNQKLSILKIKA